MAGIAALSDPVLGTELAGNRTLQEGICLCNETGDDVVVAVRAMLVSNLLMIVQQDEVNVGEAAWIAKASW